MGEVLRQPGERAQYLYFPIDGIISKLRLTVDGDSTEIIMVGNEGAVGRRAFMGNDNSSTLEVVVRVAGSAWRVDGALFKTEFRHSQTLHDLMLRYLEAQLAMITQTAVCNRFHSIDQQLCRWMLLIIDLLPPNHLKLLMTQELIASTLGVSREEVSRAACKLQRVRVVRYKRGQITVLDRPGLERASCECYAVIKKEYYDRLPGNPVDGYAV